MFMEIIALFITVLKSVTGIYSLLSLKDFIYLNRVHFVDGNLFKLDIVKVDQYNN